MHKYENPKPRCTIYWEMQQGVHLAMFSRRSCFFARGIPISEEGTGLEIHSLRNQCGWWSVSHCGLLSKFKRWRFVEYYWISKIVMLILAGEACYKDAKCQGNWSHGYSSQSLSWDGKYRENPAGLVSCRSDVRCWIQEWRLLSTLLSPNILSEYCDVWLWRWPGVVLFPGVTSPLKRQGQSKSIGGRCSQHNHLMT